MTAVAPRPATAPEPRSRAPRRQLAVVVYAWVLSVRDWRVHALAEPSTEVPGVGAEPVATRCGAVHLAACPVSVARHGEVCPRCAAGGVAALEVLPDRRSR